MGYSLPRIIHSQEFCRALNAFGPAAILKESVGVLIPYEFLHGSTVWYAAVSKAYAQHKNVCQSFRWGDRPI
jgi:hypothetical protein